MKQKNFAAKLVFSLAILILASTLTTFGGESGATVVRLKGAARYSNGDNNWKSLHQGDKLNSGALIQTASESSVDLQLSGEAADNTQPVIRSFRYSGGNEAAQTIIRIRENSVLALDKLSKEQTGADEVTDTQLDLRAGRVFGNVKKLSAASRFEVKMPTGVAGIRGTIFDFSSTGIISVFLGSVVISYFDPSDASHTKIITKVVYAGEQYDINTGTISPIPNRGDGEQEAHDIVLVVVTPTLAPVVILVPPPPASQTSPDSHDSNPTPPRNNNNSSNSGNSD